MAIKLTSIGLAILLMMSGLFPSQAQEEEQSKEDRIKAYRDDEIKPSDNPLNFMGLSFYRQGEEEFEAGGRYEELRLRVRRSDEAVEVLGNITSMKVTSSYMAAIGFLTFASVLGISAILGENFDAETKNVSLALSGSFTTLWLLVTVAINPGLVPEIYNNYLLRRESLSREDVL